MQSRISHNLALLKPFVSIPPHLLELGPAHTSLLGQHRSHATEQSHGQSRATTQHDQTQCLKPANKMLVKRNKQPQEEPKVHTVMVPMAQPVGGWHVTSRTKHHEQNVSRPCAQDMGPTQ